MFFLPNFNNSDHTFVITQNNEIISNQRHESVHHHHLLEWRFQRSEIVHSKVLWMWISKLCGIRTEEKNRTFENISRADDYIFSIHRLKRAFEGNNKQYYTYTYYDILYYYTTTAKDNKKLFTINKYILWIHVLCIHNTYIYRIKMREINEYLSKSLCWFIRLNQTGNWIRIASDADWIVIPSRSVLKLSRNSTNFTFIFGHTKYPLSK